VDRESVHGGPGERWQVFRCGDSLDDHASERVRDGDWLLPDSGAQTLEKYGQCIIGGYDVEEL